jgi:hypothetical protein
VVGSVSAIEKQQFSIGFCLAKEGKQPALFDAFCIFLHFAAKQQVDFV